MSNIKDTPTYSTHSDTLSHAQLKLFVGGVPPDLQKKRLIEIFRNSQKVDN